MRCKKRASVELIIDGFLKIPSLITSCVSTIKLNDPLTSDSACAITRRATVCLIW